MPDLFQIIDPRTDAVTGEHYRVTYFFTGPYLGAFGWSAQAVRAAVNGAAASSGKIRSISHEFFDYGVARHLADAPPQNVWAYRYTWEKKGEGTPLAFFMGPQGTITLAIIGVVVLTVGIVLVGRTLERLSAKTPLANPGVILGAVLVLSLFALRRR